MNKLSIFIVMLFFVALALFSIHNNEVTTLKIPFGQTYELPKIGVILFSVLSGVAFMLVLVALRDTRRFINNYKLVKRQKKEERLEALYTKAINAILANDREEARKIIEEHILKEEPEHTKALMRMGDIASLAENHDKAAEYYRRALSSSGGRNLEALFALEAEMQALKRWDEALTYAEEILDLDQDNLSALERKRFVLERLERWADLVEVQKSVLKHNHLDNQKAEEARLNGYRYEQARQSLEAGELDRAGKLFRTVLRHDKDFIASYLGAAEVLLREDDPEAAVEFLERGYEASKSVIILARLEDLLISLSEPDKIIKLYQTALDRRPDDVTLKLLLGKLYYRLEMVDDALDTLRGLEGAESYPALYGLLGELYMRREHYENAARCFRRAMEMKPSRFYYCCRSCGHLSAEWSGRCPACGIWDSYDFDLYGRCKL